MCTYKEYCLSRIKSDKAFDSQIKLMKLVAITNVGFFGAVIAVTLLAIHGNMRLTVVGILCAGLTVGMYASPLAVMVRCHSDSSCELYSYHSNDFAIFVFNL